MDAPVRVACIQAEPVVLDREATIDKLERLAAEAAGERRRAARLPGDVRPGVPVAAGRAHSRRRRRRDAFALLARESVDVPGPDADADRRGRPRRTASGSSPASTSSSAATIYNTLLFHAPDGTLALKHRKLVPTNHERLVWGQGDGGGLGDRRRRSAGSAA